MEKKYNPSQVEDRWYKYWIEKNLFHADEKSKKQKYSIVIPPPNVTGVLHMGHALNNTIQDILIRYKRMGGFEALWMPGTDHAGIATQNVVERKLAKDKKTRHDLGREAFIEKVWEWKNEYHTTITSQLKKMGCSCDWERERFTMDEGLSKAVRKVFVKLYNEGLIYKGKYIINWCPRCQTALSDEEAEHKDLKGKLYYFRYPFSDGNGFITVATTRPETMLGDTAVAVNPKDERYLKMTGRMIKLPLVNREIPLIADDFVAKEFGTGAVKITPAHDPNDFQMGQRHNCEPVVVMDETGHMTGPVPELYKGMDRFEARKKIVEDLTALGLVEKIEEHSHAVGHCYRCHTVIEPYYSDQWFVKMRPLAQGALEAAVENKVSFYPKRWKKTYIDWMENIRDWCISRQIWWGHRIPVWYCGGCGEIIVSEETPRQCPKCKSGNLHQDENVLDTWFSSWLWPFSTMGWPDKSAVMDKFYPTDTLITAPEILFFWVARMIMAGLHFTGKLPFKDVILHGTVRDKTGRKMSKSLGNSIDPLKIIPIYGADALRFSMIMITAQGADVYLGNDTFDIGRNFANKLWNASRFLLSNIEDKKEFSSLPDINEFKAEDRWIVSKLNHTIESVCNALDSYRLNEACHTIYDFTWHEFCDWYIEAKKPDLYQNEDAKKRDNAIAVSTYVLGSILKLLHPIMPFITEEIWCNLCKKVNLSVVNDSESVMTSKFPVADTSFMDNDIEEKFELLKGIITSLRTIRSENNVPPDKWGKALIIPINETISGWLSLQVNLINQFSKLSSSEISISAQKPDMAGAAVVMGNQIYLYLEGLIDINVEIERLTKEISRVQNLIESSTKRLQNKDFVSKAPQNVIEKEREKQQGLVVNLEKLQKNLDALKNSKV